MQKWEYYKAGSSEMSVEQFDELGERGWELVAVIPESEYVYTSAWFKRPKPAPPPRFKKVERETCDF